jgi:hypothetical protein
MVVRFQELGELCLHLRTSGSRVCDLILGPVGDRVHLAIHLEEAIRQLWAMQDEHRSLQNSTTRVQDLVLKRSDEASSLVASLCWTADLVKDLVNAAAASGVH